MVILRTSRSHKTVLLKLKIASSCFRNNISKWRESQLRATTTLNIADIIYKELAANTFTLQVFEKVETVNKLNVPTDTIKSASLKAVADSDLDVVSAMNQTRSLIVNMLGLKKMFQDLKLG